MTNEQVNELIEKSKPFIGKEISLKLKGSNTKLEYTFINSGNIVRMKDGDIEVFSIEGRLRDKNNNVYNHPLSLIVKEFEKIMK